MDINKFNEKAEVIDLYYLAVQDTEQIVTFKIKDNTINCFNPFNLDFKIGKTYNVSLALSSIKIVKSDDLIKYIKTDYEGDCYTNGEIIELLSEDIDKKPTILQGIVDSGVLIGVDIPKSFKIGDYITLEGRLDIDNSSQNSFHGSSR